MTVSGPEIEVGIIIGRLKRRRACRKCVHVFGATLMLCVLMAGIHRAWQSNSADVGKPAVSNIAIDLARKIVEDEFVE